MLAELISRGVGRPFQEFARDVFFEPLGIASFEWMTGRDGVASAASGLRLTPLDLARIGQTVLDQGKWKGQEIAPSKWLDQVLQLRINISEHRNYGYHWYMGESLPSVRGASAHSIRWFGGLGNGGQVLFLLPNHQLVVAITAGNYNLPDRYITPLTIMEEVILASVRW